MVSLDWLEGFKVPRRGSRAYDDLPTLDDIRAFYYAIEDEEVKLMYLLYVVSGRGRNEILSLTMDELDLDNRCIKPRFDNLTKRRGISFFTFEVKDMLARYIEKRKLREGRIFSISRKKLERSFKEVRKLTGLNITPQVVRVWFSNELRMRGVDSSYVNIFQGRAPTSVIENTIHLRA